MKKFVFLLVVSLLQLNAAVYKGQKVYVKECKKCHGTGQKIAASLKKREWIQMLDSNGQKLSQIHLASEKARKSWDYFESSKYTKRTRHLKDFMVEYAKDSGKVPACND